MVSCMEIDPGFRETKFILENWPDQYEEYRSQWRYLPIAGILSDYPLHLDIELTNRCNLKCPFCVREYMTDELGDMKEDIFRLLLRQLVGSGVKSVKLNWRGEPTLHNLLPDFIMELKSINMQEVMINTNGVAISEKLAKRLILSGLDRIIWSIDSIEPDRYEEMRVGAQLFRVINNLKTFIRTREREMTARPYIRVQKIDLPQTRDEDYIEFFRKLGVDSVAINTYKEKAGEKVDWEPLPCAQPWQRMVLSWDGYWYPCCQGHNFETMGHIYNVDLWEAWHSPLMNRLRKYHGTGRQKAIAECRRCETTKPIK